MVKTGFALSQANFLKWLKDIKEKIVKCFVGDLKLLGFIDEINF